MRMKHLIVLAAATGFAVVPSTSLSAAVNFRGTPGSYAASNDHLGGGADTLSTWTVELWVRPTAAVPQSGYGLFDIHGNWKQTTISLNESNSVGCLTMWPSAYYGAGSGPGLITPNEWQLLAFVSDGQHLRIYRNGTLAVTGDVSPQVFIAGEIAGAVSGVFNFAFSDYQTLPDANYYAGSMADFRVWNRALTPTELSGHVASQPATNATGLLNWIPFNETSGNTFHDIVGGVTGTYYNVDFVSDPVPKTLTDGLVVYYPFSGNANDESGNGNHGVVNGAKLTADRFGSPSSAFSFDVYPQSVDTSSASSPLGTADFTVSLWANISTLPADAQIFFCNSVVNDFQLNLYPNGTSDSAPIHFQMGGDYGPLEVQTADVAWGPSTWYSIQVVRSGNSVKIYRNGNVIGENTVTSGVTAPPGSRNLRFGLGVPPQMHQLHGKLDDIRVYNRALSAAEVQALYDLEKPATTSLTDGLVAYYPFNGNANDASGSGNHGTPANTVFREVGSRLAATFTGALNSCVTVANSPSLSMTNAVTISLWYNNLGNPGGPAGFIDKAWKEPADHDWSYRSWFMYYSTGWGGSISCQANGSGFATGTGISGVADNQWYHLVFIANGAQGVLQIYNNGVLAQQDSFTQFTLSTGPYPMVIGSMVAQTDNAQTGFNGALDDVRIYDRALSAQEIGQLYDLERPKSLTDGLVAYYPFNGNANDESGNGNNGVAVNAALATDRFGSSNGSYHFNGTNAYVSVGRTPSLDSLPLLTVSTWVRFEAVTPGPYGIGLVGTPAPAGLGWALSIVPTRQLRPIASVGTLSYFDCQATMQTGAWYQVAMVFDGSQLKGFVNGQLDGTMNVSGTVTPSTSPMWLGAYCPTNPPDTSMFLQGGMDDVRIYNRALSDSEMQALYALESATPPPSTNTPPTITTQPTGRTVAVGQSATFSVTAAGTAPLSHQWRHEGTPLSGQTAASLNLANVQLAQGGSYDVVVGNVAGSITSAVAQLTVLLPPVITTAPVGRTVTVGQSVTFTAAAEGSAPLSFQWQFNGVDLPGATGTSLVLAQVSPAQAGRYRVVVSNPGGAVSSAEAILDVAALPVITQLPTGGTWTTQEPLSLQVAAAGTPPLSYQWYRDGAAIPGEIGPMFQRNPTQTEDAGGYSVVVTNAYGAVTSAPPALVVIQTFGLPRIFLDGVPVTETNTTRTSQTTVRLETDFPQGFLFYTTDGTQPDFTATEYTGEFILSESAQLRVIAYTYDFLQSVLAPTLNLQVLPAYPLTITTAGGGTFSTTPTAAAYASNSVVTVTAQASPGWTFMRWEGTRESADPVIQVTMDRPHNLRALFGGRVTTTPVGSGQVVLSPPGGLYPYGSQVLLQAAPNTNAYFVRWASDLTGSVNPGVLTITKSTNNVTGVFGTLSGSQVTFTTFVQGNGTIAVLPATNVYVLGAQVQVTATPAPGHYFTGWTGDLSGATPGATVTLDRSKLVTATFAQGFALETTALHGQILRNPNLTTFPPGTTVHLTAVADPGYLFTGWSGDAGGTADAIDLVMNGPQSVTAHFGSAMTLDVVTSGAGHVTRHPDAAAYAQGSIVELLATPQAGFVFDRWSGDASGTANPLDVTLDRSKLVQASFRDIQAPTVTLTSPASGTVDNEHFNLSGSFADNVGVISASWEWNGQSRGALVTTGTFSVTGLTLLSGANTLVVRAIDALGNVGSAQVTVTWAPRRIVWVGEVEAVQDGDTLDVPIWLNSADAVGGMSFRVYYDTNYLQEPSWTWAAMVGSSVGYVNADAPGEVYATFSFGNHVTLDGEHKLAALSFRARSVPSDLDTVIDLEDVEISQTSGQPFGPGTEVRDGFAHILRRRILGDNNANNRLDVGDATVIQRLITSPTSQRAWDRTWNDLNGSSSLDSGDVTMVLRKVVLLEPPTGGGKSAAEESLGSFAAEGAKADLAELEQSNKPDRSKALTSSLLPRSAARQPGETFTVQVVVDHASNQIAGASFRLDYPTNALRLLASTSFVAGPIVPAGGAAVMWNVAPTNSYATQFGQLHFASSGPNPWGASNGVLAEVTFQVQPGVTNQSGWAVTLSQVELTENGFEINAAAGGVSWLSPGTVVMPVVGLRLTAQDVGVQVNSQAGVRYGLEVSSDLRNWTEVHALSGTGGALELRHPTSPTGPQRFYRVKAGP